MKKLHPSAFWLFFLELVVLYFLISFLIGVFLMFASADLFFKPRAEVLSPEEFLFLLVKFFGALAIVFIILDLVIAKLTYENWRYELKDEALRIEKGVLVKRYVSIPYERIQNVDIVRGLLARMLRLSDLQIQTAGASGTTRYGGSSEGRLPGLSIEDAESLRDSLIKRSKGMKQGV